MDKEKVKRFFQLKKKQKEIEQELADLRNEIMAHFEEQGVTELEIGSYSVKMSYQNRKEYDDNKLYNALANPDAWRKVSKADPSKIANLLKLNLISEETIQDTYSIKTVPVLTVDKK